MARTSSGYHLDVNKIVFDLKRLECIVDRLLEESSKTSQLLKINPTTTEHIQALIDAMVDNVKGIPDQIGIYLKQKLEVRLESLIEKWHAVLENTNTFTTWKFPVISHTVAKKPSAPSAKNTFQVRVAIDNSAGASSSSSSFVSSETLNSDNCSSSLPEEFTSEGAKCTLTSFSPKSISSTDSGTQTSKSHISGNSYLLSQLGEAKANVEKQLAVSPISNTQLICNFIELLKKVSRIPKRNCLRAHWEEIVFQLLSKYRALVRPSSLSSSSVLSSSSSMSSLSLSFTPSSIASSETTSYLLSSFSEILEKLDRSIELFFALNCPLNALPKIEELERTVQLIPLSEPKLIDQWKAKVANIRNHFKELTNCQENGGTLAKQQKQSMVRSLSNNTTVSESLSEHGADKPVVVLNSTTNNSIETAGEGNYDNGTNTFDAFYRQGQMEEEMNQLKATIEAHIEADEEDAAVSGIINLSQLVEAYVKEFGANDCKWTDIAVSFITRFVVKPQKQSNIENEDDDDIYGYICPIQSHDMNSDHRV